MSAKRIIPVALCLIVIIGFISIGLRNAVETRNRIDLQQVQLRSKSTEIKELNIKYDHLNFELDKAANEKNVNKEQIDKLNKEKESLERQKKDLESQLQAKLDKQNSIAQAKQDAINASIGSKKATAASGNSDVKSIIVEAAIKYGIDPDHALRIANCESTFNPSSVNYNYTDPTTGTHPMGLYQHVEAYWNSRASKYGYEGSSVLDPVANANVTMAMWKDGQSNLWECQ